MKPALIARLLKDEYYGRIWDGEWGIAPRTGTQSEYLTFLRSIVRTPGAMRGVAGYKLAVKQIEGR